MEDDAEEVRDDDKMESELPSISKRGLSADTDNEDDDANDEGKNWALL